MMVDRGMFGEILSGSIPVKQSLPSVPQNTITVRIETNEKIREFYDYFEEVERCLPSPIRLSPIGRSHLFPSDDDEVNVEPESGKQHQPVGLTEEELEPYRNDPFWKALRTVLFIAFWIVWIGLFVLAILLVVLSPGCAKRQKPNWWQTAVAYQIWVPSFQDSDNDGYGDMQGLIDRLENLRKSGVQTVWPTPLIISDNFSNAIRNYHQLDPKLGSNQFVDKAIEVTHEKGMKFVINLPIAATSTEHEWFLKSASASLPENSNYSEFYHWRTQGDAEFFSVHKGVSYLHEKNNEKAAVLNWQSILVREQMFNVLSQWIDRGVDGFHLTGIDYLARSADGKEPNWAGIADVIRDIRNHIDTFVNGSAKVSNKKIALFASRDEAKEKDKKLLVSNGLDTVVNYELGKIQKDSDICHKTEGSVATCVHEILSDILLFHANNPSVWPHWEFGNPWLSRLASRVHSRAHAQLLLMVQLMLPGSNSYYYGDELGMKDVPSNSTVEPQRGAMPWDDSNYGGFSKNAKVPVSTDYKEINWKKQYGEELSSLKMFMKLSKLRTRDPSMNAGETMMGRLIDSAGFSIARFHVVDNTTDGQVYVGAVNFAEHTITVPLDHLPESDKMGKSQILTTTSNVERFFPRQQVDFSSKSLELLKNEGVVFSYKAH